MKKQIIWLFSLWFFATVLYAANNIKVIEQELSDSMITAKITTKFTENKNLNPLKIHVVTRQGVVTLTGHVKDKEAFIAALRLAKNTNSVKEVDANDLIIKDVNTTLTDAYITAKVETAILRAKVLDDESIPLVGINATTSNGTVTLNGLLKNQHSISVIIKRVSAINGVKRIISNLKVISKDA